MSLALAIIVATIICGSFIIAFIILFGMAFRGWKF
jgi:hypothetical protein